MLVFFSDFFFPMATTQLADEGDFDLLSTIYDIIKSVEKEQQDNAQKLKDSQEAGQKVLELQRKLDHAREVVRKLPGIELSKEEQLQQIDLLRQQLTLKRDLLNKYRSITSFDREAQTEFQIHQH